MSECHPSVLSPAVTILQMAPGIESHLHMATSFSHLLWVPYPQVPSFPIPSLGLLGVTFQINLCTHTLGPGSASGEPRYTH